MPLYEYQCDTCGLRFEALQKFSDPPLDACRKCGAAVRKLQSAPAFQLKGTGWYVTDFAGKGTSAPGTSSSEGNAGGADGKADGPKDGTTEGKTDGKKDGKAEGKSDAKADSGKTARRGEGASAATPSGTSAKSD